MFEVKTRLIGDVLVADCRGRLVYGEASDRLALRVRASMPDPAQVVLSLRGVTYIDSAGIGTLVGLYTSARSRGGDVRLAAISPFVRKVLHITHLDTIFAAFDSAEAAARSYHASTAA